MGSSSSSYRLGVIGFGQWGPNHVRNFARMEGVEVVRICDRSTDRLAQATRLFRGVETTTDADAILLASDIDAVVVATPVSSHVKLVAAALTAGKDVLCEKPLCATVAECDQLGAIATAHRRILMVGHVFLYNLVVRHLADALRSSELGSLYYMDAVRTNLGPVRQDVGALGDLASHDVSIFNHLLGATPVSVAATGGAFLQNGIEDLGFLTLTYPGNVICHAHVSWLNPRKVRQLTLVGDRRMAVWDDMNLLEPVRYYDRGVTPEHYDSFGDFQMILRDGAITIPSLKLAEPLLKQDEAFIDAIRTRTPPLADWRFGRDVVRVLETAQQSRREGGRTLALPAT